MSLPRREVEDESRVEVEVEDESRVESIAPATDEDRVQTLTRIFKLIGMSQTHRNLIIANPSINKEDVLAELTRNYSRKGSGKGMVREPGKITGMNLARCELPPAEWYDQKLWTAHLPRLLREKLGLAIPGEKDDLENLSLVAIRKSEVEEKVNEFLEGRS